MVVALALALTAALAGLVSRTATGHSSKNAQTHKQATPALVAPDDQQVYPDAGTQSVQPAYPPPSGVVTRSS